MPRVIEAEAHITIGAGVAAQPTLIAGGNVDLNIGVGYAATPEELRGITINIQGPDAGRRFAQIIEAIEKLQDPDLDPEVREKIIAAIKAYEVPATEPEEGAGA